MAEHARKKVRVRTVPNDQGTAAKVGPRLVSTSTYTPLIQVEGAPDFGPHFDELLGRANVKKTLESWGALDNALKMAWVSNQLEIDSRDYPPPKLVKSLDKAICKTKRLLQDVEKHLRCRSIAFDLYPRDEKKREEESSSAPRTPPRLGPRIERLGPNGLVAEINVHRVLERVQRRISVHRRRRKRPREDGKAAIVAHAAVFFRRHSALKLTGYSDGDFANFCSGFYEAVTGETEVDPSVLEVQIKAEVKTPTFGI